jgi:L-threonylcarbamoyladenylate synthase
VSLLFELSPARTSEASDALGAAFEAIQDRRLVVFPTDTVYGIACLPWDPKATGHLFEAKRRPSELNLPVLASSAKEALDLVILTDAARRLADRFWPGPLTMVLDRGPESKSWELGEAKDTIGVRVPDHALSLALLSITGPLAVTSANLSGSPPLEDRAALQDAFGEAVAVYILARAPSRTLSGRSSTVVDLTGPELRVLREGPIDAPTLSSVMKG